MKKGTIYIMLTILIMVLAGYLLLEKGSATTNTGTDSTGTPGVTLEGNIQKVTLGIKNYNYYPNTVTVQAGKPVRIYLDKSVVGCYRSFTIRQLGIAKYLQNPSDYIEFTPEEPGTYAFACSMNMGRGTLIVE